MFKIYTVENIKHCVTVVASSKDKAESFVRENKLLQLTMDESLKVNIDKFATIEKIIFDPFSEAAKAEIKAQYKEDVFCVDVDHGDLNQISKYLFNDVIKKFDIDFKKDKYLKNNYGLSPVIDYDRAKNIISYATSLLENSNYNLNMELDKLRVQTLKSYLKALFCFKEIISC